MILTDVFCNQSRNVIAVLLQGNRVYMLGLRKTFGGTFSVLWVDVLEGEEHDIHDMLVKRLVIQCVGSSEIIFCIGDEGLVTLTRDMPGLTLKEVEHSIRLEMEYSGEECKWAYRCHDGVLTLKKISLNDYVELVDNYRGEISISGIMAVEYPEEQTDLLDTEMPDMEWGKLSSEQHNREFMGLYYTARNYLINEGCCFERVPDVFYRWDWLRIGTLLLVINIIASLIIGVGSYFRCQEIGERYREYRQQMALMENMNNMKKEAEEMKGDVRNRSRVLASLREKGIGLSGYAFMVNLSSAPGQGIILTEVRAESDKQLLLKGRAYNVGELVKYINTLGSELSIEKTQQGENGDVEFVCRGQL